MEEETSKQNAEEEVVKQKAEEETAKQKSQEETAKQTSRGKASALRRFLELSNMHEERTRVGGPNI